MDPKGFLPAHLQTKQQGTASGPHVLQGRHAGEPIDETKASEAAAGHDYTSSNAPTSDISRDSGRAGDSGLGQDDSYARQDAAANDPSQQDRFGSGRGAEDTAAVAGAGAAARHEEKHLRDNEPSRQAAAAGHTSKKHDDPVTRREAAEQRELDTGRNAQNTYGSTPATGAVGDRNVGQNPYSQQEPSNRTREEEALGAGAAAGVGAGALAHHERKKDQYADQGMTASDQRGPGAATGFGSQTTGADTLDSGATSGVPNGIGAGALDTAERRGQDTYPSQGQFSGGPSDISNTGSSTNRDEALGAGAATGLGAGAAAAGAHQSRDQDPYSREGQVTGGPSDTSGLGTSTRGDDTLSAGTASGVGAGAGAGVPATGELRDQDPYANQGQATGGPTSASNVGSSARGDEALGAGTAAGIGAGAGAGAGALHNQGTHDGGLSGRDGGLGSTGAGAGSGFDRSAGNAPHISGDPDSGFTVDGQNAGSSGTAGVTGQHTGPSQPSTTGGVAGSGTGDGQAPSSFKSEISAIADEKLFHGHHTTMTGERLDPHIGSSQ